MARGGAIARLLERWTELTSRAAPIVVISALSAATAAGFFSFRHLGMDTNTVDMLSPDLPWRVENERHKRAFPHYADNIVVVVEGETPDLAAEAQRRLADALSGESALFEDVHPIGGGPFFERNALLYAEERELEELAEGLESAAPWLAALENDPSLGHFLTVLDSLLADDPATAPLLGAVGIAFEGAMVDRVRPLPWRDLMSGAPSERSDRRRYIEILPILDFEQLLPGERAIARIDALSDSLGLTDAEGVSVRLTGFVPMAHEELRSSIGGLRIATLLALVMVGAILWVGLRSGRLIGAALLTLMVGLLLTAGFAALAVGSLNLISMAFAVLYIGLGIDYAIHYSLRYRELRTRGSENLAALTGSAMDVGSSLLLSAFTTAICFYAFVPTDFEGVSELGLIGGTGMLISFVTTVTLLPALLSLLPFRPKPGEAPLIGGVVPDLIGSWVSRRGRVALVAAGLAGIVSLILLPRVSFDLDPLSLRDPQGESTSTFRDLLADSTASPLTISLLSRDREDAVELTRRLETLDAVQAALSIRSLVPEGQQSKMPLIERIERAVGPALPEPRAGSPPEAGIPQHDGGGVDEALAQVELFRGRVRALELEGEGLDLARFADFQIQSWERWVRSVPEQTRKRAIERVERSLLGGLQGSLGALRRSASQARPFGEEDLPAEVTRRWIAPDGSYRVEVVPSERLDDQAAQRAFVEAVRTIAPHATGEPVINVSAGIAVVSAFRQALLTAAGATLLVLAMSLRSLSDAARVLLPLLLAAAITGASTVLLRLDFNYANVIALPLLLGVGVDNGIHMVHRMRASSISDLEILRSSTARAVLFASLTTVFSFGNLAFSAHPGTASMGRLLTIGMLCVLACTLVLVPALAPVRRPPTSAEPV